MVKLFRTKCRGQIGMEYLLLLGLVAFVVFLAMAPGGFLNKIHNAAKSNFDNVTSAITGANPQPINGGWCEWSLCAKPGAYHYRTCECPAPAFGGAQCQGEASQLCLGAGCAVGENCNDFCACPAGLQCDTASGSCVTPPPAPVTPASTPNGGTGGCDPSTGAGCTSDSYCGADGTCACSCGGTPGSCVPCSTGSGG